MTRSSTRQEIRVVDVDLGGIGEHPDAIEDVYRNRLDVLVLRRSLPPQQATRLAERLLDAELPWLRPNRTGPRADIRVLGEAATPTFESPRGPLEDGYFANARRYGGIIGDALGPEFDASRYIEGLLGLVSGGRPVELLVRSDGSPFAGCTLRLLPEGQGIIVHNDHGHFDLPIYAPVVADLDTRVSLSFFLVLQAPESGGELVVHAITSGEAIPRLPGGLPDEEAIRLRYASKSFELDAGDAVVFGAGKFFHHVSRVIGPRPRVTLGSFLAMDREHETVRYWN